ncbi:hypothetical protein RHGRI_020401 [Rhododendron griersonianum]|uniref:J domain-containing protein n=1 Tax=Rhododendron griersonianum TaxID=479676 RepID=A0AAV6JNL2_9ERIC|nr:hypothetical protein RHGRI_020401 [Rhododendron griersonianum]
MQEHRHASSFLSESVSDSQYPPSSNTVHSNLLPPTTTKRHPPAFSSSVAIHTLVRSPLIAAFPATEKLARMALQFTKLEKDKPFARTRVIGPEMPSAELLAAAAKLTEAEAELREVEAEEDNELFVGPPPPAVVTEAESANEAERFEEVTRIMRAEVDSPYDVLGVNRNMSADNTKKRYWKLSLMVHPDKCSHPQAHQAFIKLNKAYKDLQDPNKAELKAMREAAQWRRWQAPLDLIFRKLFLWAGISMEGDDVLLEEMVVKVGPKRDEWMTTLPPGRKPGVTTQTTKFSRTSKDGRGDTSMWTDTPSEKAQKAKMNYLEAYNEAAALATKQQEKKETTLDAALVDEYNKRKRPKSLLEKHQETAQNSSKRKLKQEQSKEE